MSFGHALYYPHINLTNKNWLKHALLFWDKISRIVPYSIEPSDNEDIIKMKHDIDFIQDYHPERWDTERTFEQFSGELRRIIESDTFFNERYFRRNYIARNYSHDYENRNSFFSNLVRSNGSYIHIQKMDNRLKNYLFEIGVAIPGEREWESWIKIDNEIGFLYMTYFAKSISINNSLPIVTDVEESFSASMYFESEINSDYHKQFEYRIGNLLIKTVVPKNINNIPIDKLLEIRGKYDNERRAFFSEISNLSESIVSIDNIGALNDAVNFHSKNIFNQTKELEKLYNINKVETINKFLGISLPSVLTSTSEYVPDFAKPLVATGGIFFGMISAAKSIQKEKLTLQSNPKSYLLNIKSELSGGNIFSRLNERVKGLRK